MLIAHLSDSHIAVPAVSGSDRSGDLQRCVEYVNALAAQPDLVVHSGDIAHYGKPAEYAEAARILDGLRAPLCVIPGNRDDRRAFRAAFARCLPENCHGEFVQYAIMRERVCAIMLDSVSTQSGKARLCEARLAHLGDMLDDAGDRPVVVFMHHPPFEIAEAPEPFQFEDRGNWEDFSSIVSQHPNVRHIYCGHSHRTASGKIAGINASTIPSIAADLRKGRPAGMQEVGPVYWLAGE